MNPNPAFPHLTEENHRDTSPDTPEYNCVAWAAGDPSRWWQPGRYWPIDVGPTEFGLSVLVEAFRSLGFEPCPNGILEPGVEKVALYADALFYTHIARQLPDGKWTSKLGQAEDIEHGSPDDLAGGVYGQVAMFMRRATG